MAYTADQFLTEYAAAPTPPPPAPPQALQGQVSTKTEGGGYSADKFVREFAPEKTDLSALESAPSSHPTQGTPEGVDVLGDPIQYINPGNDLAFGAPNALPKSPHYFPDTSISRPEQRNPLIDVPASFLGGLANTLTGKLFDPDTAAPGSGAEALNNNEWMARLRAATLPTTPAGKLAGGVGDFLGSIGGFIINPAAYGLARGRANAQGAINQAYRDQDYKAAQNLENNKVGLSVLSGASDFILSKIPGFFGKSLPLRVGTGAAAGAPLNVVQGRIEQATKGEAPSLESDLINAGTGLAFGAAGGAAPELIAAAKRLAPVVRKGMKQLSGKVTQRIVPDNQQLRLKGIEARIRTTEKALSSATTPQKIARYENDLESLRADRAALLQERVEFADIQKTQPEAPSIPEKKSFVSGDTKTPTEPLQGRVEKNSAELDTLFKDTNPDVTSELTTKVSGKTNKGSQSAKTAHQSTLISGDAVANAAPGVYEVYRSGIENTPSRDGNGTYFAARKQYAAEYLVNEGTVLQKAHITVNKPLNMANSDDVRLLAEVMTELNNKKTGRADSVDELVNFFNNHAVFHINAEEAGALRKLGYDAIVMPHDIKDYSGPVLIALDDSRIRYVPDNAPETGTRGSTFLRSEKTQEPVKAGVSEEAKTYEKVSLQDEADRAATKIDEMGLDKAEEFARTDNSPESITVGMEALKRFQKEGRMDKAITMAETLMAKGTEAAQRLSLFKIWDALSPEGTLRFAVKQVKKVHEEKIKDPLTRMLLDREMMAKVHADIKDINNKHLPAAVDAAIEKMKKLANC